MEKPLTVCLGDGSDDFNSDPFTKADALEHSLVGVKRMLYAASDITSKNFVEIEKQVDIIPAFAENGSKI